jgi:Gp49-like protein DUF891
MPSIGPRCHELRVRDGDVTWRIFYRIDQDAIVILEVLKKKTAKTDFRANGPGFLSPAHRAGFTMTTPPITRPNGAR